MSFSAALMLRDGDKERLGDLAQLPAVPAELARRARIVLLAAEGRPNAEIARTLGVSRPTVIGWRERYVQSGIKGLEDEPRSGRPPEIDELDVILVTLAHGGNPPARLASAHWSARLLAAELGISFASVARIWRKWGIQPHQTSTYSFRTQPPLEFRISGIAGLFLDPPTAVVVLAADLDGVGEPTSKAPMWQSRTDGELMPVLLKRCGEPARRPPHSVTPTARLLVTALAEATGRVVLDAGNRPGDRSELLRFLELIGASHRDVALRIVADGLGPDAPRAVQAWLAANPRATFHAATDDCSWQNLVEVCFGVAAVEADLVGCRSGKQVTAAISRFVQANGVGHPTFAWVGE
jgi:transposase